MIDDMDIVDMFEENVSKYAGSKYGVAISSGTNAIFLSLLYLKYVGELNQDDEITIPSRTYASIPMSIINAGLKVKFEPISWSGIYQLKPTRIYDCATRFTKEMCIQDSLQCLSFQYKKHLPIGRGGMVLTDNKDASEWLKQARIDGKHRGISQLEDKYEMIGWNMYMIPEDAARGITLLGLLKDNNPNVGCQNDYPDLSKQEIFK